MCFKRRVSSVVCASNSTSAEFESNWCDWSFYFSQQFIKNKKQFEALFIENDMDTSDLWTHYKLYTTVTGRSNSNDNVTNVVCLDFIHTAHIHTRTYFLVTKVTKPNLYAVLDAAFVRIFTWSIEIILNWLLQFPFYSTYTYTIWLP